MVRCLTLQPFQIVLHLNSIEIRLEPIGEGFDIGGNRVIHLDAVAGIKTPSSNLKS